MVDSKVFQSIIVGVATVILDYLFHSNFTSPMETNYYFIIKFIVASYIAWLILGGYLGILAGSPSNRRIIYGAIGFALVFSFYYRILEYVQGKAFASRVPDIILNGITYSYSTQPFMTALLWGIAHGLFFYVAFRISEKVFPLFFAEAI